MFNRTTTRTAGRRMAGAIASLLLSATAGLAMDLPKNPGDAPDREVSRKSVGAWTIVGLLKSNQTGYCVAERQVAAAGGANLTFGFVKDGGNYGIVITSPTWDLTPQATFPVSLIAGTAVNGDGRALAATKNLVVIPLGNNRALVSGIETQQQLDVKTSSTTIKLPLDQFAAAHAELDACIASVGRTAANPFAAPDAPAPALKPTTTPAGLIEEPTFLTVRKGKETYRLEAIIVRPAKASGRLPIALITHGKNRSVELPLIRAELMLPQARDLAHRGWLAVAVVRRGFGRSDGTPGVTASDPFVSCQSPDLRRGFDAEADDIDGALHAVVERPDADASRAIAIGVSAGGGTVLALAARQPKGLLAVVNVSGGLQVTNFDGRSCADEALVSAMKSFGANTRVPTLWLYAENDSLFVPALVRRMRDAYVGAGGKADLQAFGPIPGEGHFLFQESEGRGRWLGALDKFLRTNNLPTWNQADVVAAIKAGRIPESNRTFVEQYFSAFTPKVLVKSRSGSWFQWSANPAGVEVAQQNALAQCKQKAKEECVVVLENFQLADQAMKTATAATSTRRQ